MPASSVSRSSIWRSLPLQFLTVGTVSKVRTCSGPDRFALSEAKRAIAHFHRNFALASVTICGGEPFLHPDLDAILAFAKARGLHTSVCTNGYRIGKILERIGGNLDELRVPLMASASHTTP